MRQKIGNGAIIDTVTERELEAALAGVGDSEVIQRVRAPYTVTVGLTSTPVVLIYKVPLGMEFELRRFSIFVGGMNLPAQSTPGANNYSVGGATPPAGGLALLRSDTLIEWLQPQSAGLFQIPGIQTWSREQGPYLRNGEVLQLSVIPPLGSLPVGAGLAGVAEGILKDMVPLDG